GRLGKPRLPQSGAVHAIRRDRERQPDRAIAVGCSRRIQGTRLVLWIALGLVMPGRALSAQDPAAEARFNAKAVLISARVVYLSTQSYAGVTPKLLEERNPGLRIFAD